MRFDPQAGFTPTDEAVAGMPSAPTSLKGGGVGAVWIGAAALVLGVIGVGAWQLGVPMFSPKQTSAQDESHEEHAADQASASIRERAALMDAIEQISPRRSTRHDPLTHRDATTGWMTTVAGGAAHASPEPSLTTELHEQPSAETLLQAEKLMARGKYAEASSLLREVLRHAPNDAEVRYKLGLSCVMQRDVEGARAELEQLRTLNPSLASLLGNLVPKG